MVQTLKHLNFFLNLDFMEEREKNALLYLYILKKAGKTETNNIYILRKMLRFIFDMHRDL